jgi:hypothetical protein
VVDADEPRLDPTDRPRVVKRYACPRGIRVAVARAEAVSGHVDRRTEDVAPVAVQVPDLARLRIAQQAWEPRAAVLVELVGDGVPVAVVDALLTSLVMPPSPG